MGLILDSSVAITAERNGLPVEGMLAWIRQNGGSLEIALSVVSVMELEQLRQAAKRARTGQPPEVPGRSYR
jgi:hypothetical protein